MTMGKMSETKFGEVVGRAELKLAEAAKAFRYDFRDKIVLDIGSSTGGFTEYALRHGAVMIVAVEKGTNQMKAPLRFDSRIVLLEKTDIFEVVRSEQLKVTTKSLMVVGRGEVVEFQNRDIDTVVADVSFVSLKKVLQHVKQKIVGKNTDYLVMLKPQFEAFPDQLVRGVVKNERIRREILRNFEQWLGKHGFVVVAKRDNETVGKVGGNRERFYWLKTAR